MKGLNLPENEPCEFRTWVGPVTKIIVSHFSKYGPDNYKSLALKFVSARRYTFVEFWDNEKEQERFAKLKHHIRIVAELYNGMHWRLASEIGADATLPREVLNGSYLPSGRRCRVIRGRSTSSGKVVGFRADMDALPIHEITGPDYASEIPGMMRAGRS